MPESAADYHARIRTHGDADGRLALPAGGIPYWEVFPFELEGLRLKPVEAPLDTEPARVGEDPTECRCADPAEAEANTVWHDDGWRLKAFEPSGAPVLLMLQPREHYDLATLPPELAAQLGILMTRVAAGVESLPSVARCHVSRWGDGGAHLHVFFMARPALLGQLRGTCMALWDDFLPAVPKEVFDENVAAVVDYLVSSYGGSRAHG
ncbi:MAG TPA: hypothetical protein VGN48_09540 [Pedococcus sp.]|jgi:diadenosine tetraphosphate (Ap4A) HIT family hydrolase|nr:hypothetical protein [Pedococcus sp.]